ncbi:MAG: putative toxin-antitoxin system toxin component, PIN family [Thermomicrobiales bacterium]|nr:putative toxin-antitoxin system toxin component, PIN family [Thermomicrobiales bacterium]
MTLAKPVILDTNIYISYLLSAQPEGLIVHIVRAMFAGTFRAALPPEQITELDRAVRSKPYLRAKISGLQFDTFLQDLQSVTELLEPIVGDVPRVFRDVKDDYLFAYATRNELDILVSGDLDLLDKRGRWERPIILTPAEFHTVLLKIESSYP